MPFWTVANVIKDLKSDLGKFKKTFISHIFREANSVANWFAKDAVTKNSKMMWKNDDGLPAAAIELIQHFLIMIGYAKSHVGRGVIKSHVELFLIHNSVYRWHALWAGINRTTKIRKNIFDFSVSKKVELYKTTSRIGFSEPKEVMVGERIRREPSGEAENWKEKKKVWHKL